MPMPTSSPRPRVSVQPEDLRQLAKYARVNAGKAGMAAGRYALGNQIPGLSMFPYLRSLANPVTGLQMALHSTPTAGPEQDMIYPYGHPPAGPAPSPVPMYPGLQQLQQAQQPPPNYGGYSGYWDGGAVRGQGGPRSDSMPALVSPGEWIAPADTVRAVGLPALEGLRMATHRFGYADGGPTQDPNLGNAARALMGRGRAIDEAVNQAVSGRTPTAASVLPAPTQKAYPGDLDPAPAGGEARAVTPEDDPEYFNPAHKAARAKLRKAGVPGYQEGGSVSDNPFADLYYRRVVEPMAGAMSAFKNYASGPSTRGSALKSLFVPAAQPPSFGQRFSAQKGLEVPQADPQVQEERANREYLSSMYGVTDKTQPSIQPSVRATPYTPEERAAAESRLNARLTKIGQPIGPSTAPVYPSTGIGGGFSRVIDTGTGRTNYSGPGGTVSFQGTPKEGGSFSTGSMPLSARASEMMMNTVAPGISPTGQDLTRANQMNAAANALRDARLAKEGGGGGGAGGAGVDLGYGGGTGTGGGFDLQRHIQNQLASRYQDEMNRMFDSAAWRSPELFTEQQMVTKGGRHVRAPGGGAGPEDSSALRLAMLQQGLQGIQKGAQEWDVSPTEQAKYASALQLEGLRQASEGPLRQAQTAMYGAQAGQHQAQAATAQQLADLHSQYMREPDRAKKAALAEQIQALMGKSQEGNYMANVVGGGYSQELGGNNPSVLMLTNKITGQTTPIPAGGPGGAGGASSIPGSVIGNDGKLYAPDPNRPGKWQLVTP